VAAGWSASAGDGARMLKRRRALEALGGALRRGGRVAARHAGPCVAAIRHAGPCVASGMRVLASRHAGPCVAAIRRSVGEWLRRGEEVVRTSGALCGSLVRQSARVVKLRPLLYWTSYCLIEEMTRRSLLHTLSGGAQVVGKYKDDKRQGKDYSLRLLQVARLPAAHVSARCRTCEQSLCDSFHTPHPRELAHPLVRPCAHTCRCAAARRRCRRGAADAGALSG